MQGDLKRSIELKKRAVKLGGPHRPLPSDGGGRIPPEGSLRERVLDPPPGKSRRRGRLIAGDTLHLVMRLAFRQRYRDEA